MNVTYLKTIQVWLTGKVKQRMKENVEEPGPQQSNDVLFILISLWLT